MRFFSPRRDEILANNVRFVSYEIRILFLTNQNFMECHKGPLSAVFSRVFLLGCVCGGLVVMYIQWYQVKPSSSKTSACFLSGIL